jgi:hypothetical protein
MEAGADVRFDFEGSLALARRLWELADQIETLMDARVCKASDGLSTWLGTYGTDFAGRIDTEYTDIANIAGQLRAGAYGWAANWKAAMDQQNRVLHARRVKEVESDRSLLDKGIGFFTGHDDLPPEPEPAGTPAAPGFQPTRSFVRY